MDIVYLLKRQSDYTELYYSLRSIKNIPHNQVFIVWPLVPRLTRNIIHIQCFDNHVYRTQNTYHKVLTACNDDRVSDDFILMNDDFYITRPVKNIPYLYKGTIQQHLEARYRSKLASQPLTSIIEDTFDPEDKDFEMHAPFIINKKKFKCMTVENWMMIYRSLYCKMYWIEWQYARDRKVKNRQQLKECKKEKPVFISTKNSQILDPLFIRFIEKITPQSKYVR